MDLRSGTCSVVFSRAVFSRAVFSVLEEILDEPRSSSLARSCPPAGTSYPRRTKAELLRYGAHAT